MRRSAPVLLALALAACVGPPDLPPQPPSEVSGPVVAPRWSAIEVDAAPVGIGDLALEKPDAPVRFLGGLVLTSASTSRLHGLSDLRVDADGRLLIVSDDGDLVRGVLRSDAAGRPLGLDRVEIKPLTGRDAAALPAGKAHTDAEGLARLPDGRFLVSFEREHRVWLYDAEGRRARPAPTPKASMPENEGLEALALFGGGYLAGSEGGDTWFCRLDGGCAPTGAANLAHDGFGLVSLAALDGDRALALLRAWDPIRGARLKLLEITAPATSGARSRELLKLVRPATVDNFEGVAAIPQPGGGWRVYLLSDDNASDKQRTLVLAFDWKG